VKNKEVLHRGEDRNVFYNIQRRKANWIGYVFRRISLLKHVIEEGEEGRMEVKRTQARRSKQILDDLEEKRGYRKLTEEATDRAV
jgi:hypothetical protein